MSHKVFFGENLNVLETQIEDGTVDLCYIDPPFYTGKQQKRGEYSYNDNFDTRFHYIGFIQDRIKSIYPLLKPNGSIFVHIDPKHVHLIRRILDTVFGFDNFQNEIIWAYDYGGRSKKKWPQKHDNILWYSKDKDDYIFNYHEMDRIPYMAPGLVGKEKAARGKTPTDVWWHTIVATQSKEKSGYPTQKPLGVIERIIKVHSNPGDTVLDAFAGSGTIGVASAKLDRLSILIDSNPQAIDVITKRMENYDYVLLDVGR